MVAIGGSKIFFSARRLVRGNFINLTVTSGDTGCSAILISTRCFIRTGDPAANVIHKRLLRSCGRENRCCCTVIPHSTTSFVTSAIIFSSVTSVVRSNALRVFAILCHCANTTAVATGVIMAINSSSFGCIFVRSRANTLCVGDKGASGMGFNINRAVAGVYKQFGNIIPTERAGPTRPTCVRLLVNSKVTRMAPTIRVITSSISITTLVSNSVSGTSGLIHLGGIVVGRSTRRSNIICCTIRKRSAIPVGSVISSVRCPLSAIINTLINIIFRGRCGDAQLIIHSRSSIRGRCGSSSSGPRITIRLIRASAGICITSNVLITRGTRVYLISLTNHVITANIGDVSVGGLSGRICLTVAVCNSNEGCMAGIILWSNIFEVGGECLLSVQTM